MIRPLLLVTAAASAFAAPAFAQDEPDNWSVTFGAATDYRSKGVSKTLGDPYAFGELEWQTDNEQVYVAVAVARVKQSIGASGEADITVGYRPEVAGFNLDLNAMYRVYPDANSGTDNDYWEFTADASRYILSPHDGHPNALMHERIAGYILDKVMVSSAR